MTSHPAVAPQSPPSPASPSRASTSSWRPPPRTSRDAKVDAVIAYFRKTRGDFTAEKQAAKREGRKAKLAQSVTNKMSLGDLGL